MTLERPGVEPTGALAGARAWPAGPTLVRALAAGAALLTVGALLGRPDVALLGLPAVLVAVGALVVRPRGIVLADVEPVPGSTDLAAHVHLTAPEGAEAVRLRLTRPGHGSTEVLLRVVLERTVPVVAPSVRTGPQDLARVETQGLGPALAAQGPVTEEQPRRVLVLPTAQPLGATPLPVRLRGLSGQHEARRLGDGGGLRDVHPFQPGDPARRIDWRTTARRSPGLDPLYVRRTHTLAEAVVTLVVDSRDDVGPDPGTWSGVRATRPDDATSLDLARQAAASVAQAYLAVGDRVGVEDLGVRRRALRPGSGRRQLDRVLHQLALVRPEGDATGRLRPPAIAAGSLVVLFSTFLDPEAATLALVWRRSGHRVLAVDVLPRLRERGLDRRERLALRILRIERGDRLDDLVAAGVELVHWAEGDAAAVLQSLARRSHRGRATRAG